ncbi:hypothetical protein GWK47_048101 [Chionoecetes opilio]|uniref:DUF4758 domain-containing protein n=1 Tax=Chionoecetes opilio TaxID=41210 RepID=A0A8J5CV28_CHIOP|nr:hypothetical protein GWK47_048101 [Chionoecetes opilio]
MLVQNESPQRVVGGSNAQVAPVYIPGSADGVEPVALQVVEATPVVMARAVASSTPEAAAIRPSSRGAYFTKTVYGFLDFTTTVGSTVMVFTPQSTADEPTTTSSRKSPSARKVPPTGRSAKPAPTPTLPQLSVTTRPPTPDPKLSPHVSSTLESSFFEPTTTLALEELFSATPRAPEPQPQSKVQTATPKPKSTEPARRPFAFRNRDKNSESSTGSRRRLDLNYYLTRKKTQPERRRLGGSTLVPITVEGTGTLTALATRVDPASPPSPLPLATPSEVVVSATQGFASLSVIGPFSTAINNELGQVSQYYDFLSSEVPLQASHTYDLLDVDDTASSFPTGLVTKMGGTIVSDGHTTKHETSVIGTYIEGKYAQVLKSTSHIIHNTPTLPMAVLSSPTLSPEYETVKSVIQGSATQFITPEVASSLPLESLFSDQTSGNRDSRTTQDSDSFIQARLRSALSKRRGSHDSSFQTRPRAHDDPFLDEEETHDLQKSGTNLRPSFKLFRATSIRKTPDVRTSVRRAQEVSTQYAQSPEPEARTFRPRYKPTATPTRRFAATRATRPTRLRPSASGPKRPLRPASRFRPGASLRPKPTGIRRPAVPEPEYKQQQQRPRESLSELIYQPSNDEPLPATGAPETLAVTTTTIAYEGSDVLVELATVRSLHTFRVGTTKNTRHVTFTKTFTLEILPTATPELELDAPTTAPIDDPLYETPLFENILDSGSREIYTLPPIELAASDIGVFLETVTETFSTTEVMEQTSVLPVVQAGGTTFHTLTQTYHITRVVTAFKTMPPLQAFSFIPENSLNEFNGQLLAEGSENDEALLPGEVELDPNGEVLARDPSLAQLAGGQFNPEAMEQQLHPELIAALQQRQQQQNQQQKQTAQQVNPLGGAPQLLSGQLSAPVDPSVATPGLTPEQVQQLAYLRLLNPYGFGGFPQMQGSMQGPSTTVTSSPVTITTDITTTSTRVFRVIFNARPIMTTISSVETVHTTLTTFSTSTVTITPSLGGGFPFAFPASPFQMG